MKLKDGQLSCKTQWRLYQRGRVTHVEYFQGSLDKVGLFVRDPEWKSELGCFQGVPRCYTMAMMRMILMEML